MSFSKHDIKEEMQRSGFVPLFTHDDQREALQVVATAYKAGVRIFEFTNRKKNSFDTFRFLLANRNQFPDLMLGIGTVMDGATTQQFIDAGADFIISPILNLEMAAVCRKNNKLWIPGCATMTEIVTATQNGAEVIKIFPGSVLGPGFVSAVKAVVPDLNLLITGGVEPNEESISAWFKAGAMSVGLGSQLFRKEILEKKDWTSLEREIAHVVSIAKRLRSN